MAPFLIHLTLHRFDDGAEEVLGRYVCLQIADRTSLFTTVVSLLSPLPNITLVLTNDGYCVPLGL